MPVRHDTFHSEEAQSILGRAPSWVVRWGVTVVFCIFGGILLGCYFIKYPDTIEAPAVITDRQSALRSGGALRRADRQRSASATESASNGESSSPCCATPRSGRTWNASRRICVPPTRSRPPPSQPVRGLTGNMRSGSCNPPSPTSKAAAATTATTLRRTISPAKKSFCANRSPKTVSIMPSSNGSGRCCRRTSTTAPHAGAGFAASGRSRYLRRRLRSHGPELPLEAERPQAGFDATLTSTELQISSSRSNSWSKLTLQQENETAEYERALEQSRQQLAAQIAQWRQQYVLEAPVAGASGRVTLVNYWSGNQHVAVGDKLASIVPDGATEVIGRPAGPLGGLRQSEGRPRG